MKEIKDKPLPLLFMSKSVFFFFSFCPQNKPYERLHIYLVKICHSTHADRSKQARAFSDLVSSGFISTRKQGLKTAEMIGHEPVQLRK